MRKLYNLLLWIFFPYVFLHLIIRGFRNSDYWHRWGERLGYIPYIKADHVFWIHAVSVGEVRAAALLIPSLEKRYSEYRILITTMTPTGSDQVRSLFGGQVEHCYLAYDFSSAINRFLDRIHPDMVMVMETEMWPNLFHACFTRKVPILVSNVRMSVQSMRGYQRFRKLTETTLKQVSYFAAQSEADATRLKLLGAPADRVEVTGSIKFELNVPASLFEAAEVLRRQWGSNRPIWIAASTREGEDEYILKAFAELKHVYSDLLLVLVPRHIERCNAIQRMITREKFQYSLRTEQQGEVPANIDILLGNTMGELLLFYGASDVAFIGGSLVPTGGHNLLEAAALACPVVIGPHVINFQEITDMAVALGAAVQIKHSGDLSSEVEYLLRDAEARYTMGEKGKQMVQENRGALKKNLTQISRLLKSGSQRKL